MKYKVGDKVRIKSKEWYDAQIPDQWGQVGKDIYELAFIPEMNVFLGKEATVIDVGEISYVLDIDNDHWQDWMLEDVNLNK